MARPGSTKSTRQPLTGKTRRHSRRMLGTGTAAGAFSAFGLTPLATAPSAQADEVS